MPYVALIHGLTMSGATGLSVHGTYRVATEKTIFSMPETAIGLFTDAGASYCFPRLPGNLGMYLALTGGRLVGKDVKLVGIATHFVAATKLPDLETGLLSLQNSDHSSVQAVLDRYDRESEIQRDVKFSLDDRMDMINDIFGESSVEVIMDKLRQNSTDWAKNTLGTLKQMASVQRSPTSLKVEHRLITEGKTKTLYIAECLKTEYRLARRLLRGHDFCGVRAKLIDKDDKPQWKPNRLQMCLRRKSTGFLDR